MAESKVKERVIDAVRALPEDATVEDAIERLYFLAKVEEGIRQADAGQAVSHDEARRRILDCSNSVGLSRRSRT
jgi:predicted transcriptional regulator